MAVQRVSSGRKFKITAGDTYILGDAANTVVGTFGVQLVNDGSFVGQITVKARSRVEEADKDGVAFQTWRYAGGWVNGAASDFSLLNGVLTTDSNILIPASGQEIALDVTAYTSGSLTAYVVPMEGAAV